MMPPSRQPPEPLTTIYFVRFHRTLRHCDSWLALRRCRHVEYWFCCHFTPHTDGAIAAAICRCHCISRRRHTPPSYAGTPYTVVASSARDADKGYLFRRYASIVVIADIMLSHLRRHYDMMLSCYAASAR